MNSIKSEKNKGKNVNQKKENAKNSTLFNSTLNPFKESVEEIINSEKKVIRNERISEKEILLIDLLNKNLAQNSKYKAENKNIKLLDKGNSINVKNILNITNYNSQNKKKKGKYTYFDLFLDVLFVIALIIMAVSVVLILIMISKNIQRREIDQINSHDMVNEPDTIVENCSVLDNVDVVYSEINEKFENTEKKNPNGKINNNSLTTGSNSYPNNFCYRNFIQNDQMNNEIDNNIYENNQEDKVESGSSGEKKFYHNKHDYVVV